MAFVLYIIVNTSTVKIDCNKHRAYRFARKCGLTNKSTGNVDNFVQGDTWRVRNSHDEQTDFKSERSGRLSPWVGHRTRCGLAFSAEAGRKHSRTFAKRRHKNPTLLERRKHTWFSGGRIHGILIAPSPAAFKENCQ